MEPEFDWDPAKAQSNFTKHGITFEAARDAVLDPFRLEQIDDRFEYDEERLRIIGVSHDRLLVVITVSYAENHYRILSARKATRAEKAEYRDPS